MSIERLGRRFRLLEVFIVYLSHLQDTSSSKSLSQYTMFCVQNTFVLSLTLNVGSPLPLFCPLAFFPVWDSFEELCLPMCSHHPMHLLPDLQVFIKTLRFPEFRSQICHYHLTLGNMFDLLSLSFLICRWRIIIIEIK